MNAIPCNLLISKRPWKRFAVLWLHFVLLEKLSDNFFVFSLSFGFNSLLPVGLRLTQSTILQRYECTAQLVCVNRQQFNRTTASFSVWLVRIACVVVGYAFASLNFLNKLWAIIYNVFFASLIPYELMTCLFKWVTHE